MANQDHVANASRAGVLRLALTGGIAATVFYILCWIGARLPVGTATHMYLQLFTDEDLSSTASLIEGTCWSLAFGLIAGALLALAYNATAGMDRR